MNLMIKNNKTYDILKYVAQIFLPAVATLYFALAQVWGIPYGSEIVGTIVAVDTFLGVLLGISTAQYNKSEHKFDGSIEVTETDGLKTFSLNLDSDPEDLLDKDEVAFKVKPKK